MFGFFVDDVNIATLPGTGAAVSIKNVNQYTNEAFYINNDPSDGKCNTRRFEMDGLTTVLSATVQLTPGKHHLKLGIADAGDSSYDSNVFIKAGGLAEHCTRPTLCSEELSPCVCMSSHPSWGPGRKPLSFAGHPPLMKSSRVMIRSRSSACSQ